MDAEELRTVAHRVCAGLPAARVAQPFGPGADVYKVVGKVFAIVSDPTAEGSRVDRGGRTMVTLKCAPPHAAALVRDNAAITPGYHVNKRHWITIEPGATVDETLVADLCGNSYDLVVAGLPRDKRPLSPGPGPGPGPGPERGPARTL